MASIKLRRVQNVAGDFFVDSTCIDCDLCRQIAPRVFSRAGEQSAVHSQPESPEEKFTALKALVTCPTASIGTVEKHSARDAALAYPEPVLESVYFCGYASEASYGAASYLIVRPAGNVLVDSPRFARPLAAQIRRLGGVRWMFLTHQDDVADHARWCDEFKTERILHRADWRRAHGAIERLLDGKAPKELDFDLLAIPTPGHTRGHVVLLYRRQVLFSGDHVRWSDAYGSLYTSPDVCWYSWEEQIESMERLLDYRFEWVLPGHGRRCQARPEQMRLDLEKCVERMKNRHEGAVGWAG